MEKSTLLKIIGMLAITYLPCGVYAHADTSHVACAACTKELAELRREKHELETQCRQLRTENFGYLKEIARLVTEKQSNDELMKWQKWACDCAAKACKASR